MLNNSSTYHDFILDCQYSFYFFPTLLFVLSSFEVITNFYSLPMFLSFIFLSLCFFKWGEAFGLPQCSAQPAHIFIRWPHAELFFLAHNFTSKTRFNKNVRPTTIYQF